MEIHLRQHNIVQAINKQLFDKNSKDVFSVYITSGHTIHTYYTFSDLSNVKLEDSKQLYVVAKVSNSEVDFYEDIKKLMSSIVGTMAVALDAEDNQFKISEKDFVGKSNTTKSTYFFFKLDKVEAR